MNHATRFFSTLGAGLMLGSLLYIPHHYAPDLMPWAIGFMLACLAANTRTMLGD